MRKWHGKEVPLHGERDDEYFVEVDLTFGLAVPRKTGFAELEEQHRRIRSIRIRIRLSFKSRFLPYFLRVNALEMTTKAWPTQTA